MTVGLAMIWRTIVGVTLDGRFGARNVSLTVAGKKRIISFIDAVKTHIHAGGRKPLIWLRCPPSASIFNFHTHGI
jgi:hypothetical protein